MELLCLSSASERSLSLRNPILTLKLLTLTVFSLNSPCKIFHKIHPRESPLQRSGQERLRIKARLLHGSNLAISPARHVLKYRVVYAFTDVGNRTVCASILNEPCMSRTEPPTTVPPATFADVANGIRSSVYEPTTCSPVGASLDFCEQRPNHPRVCR